MFALASENPLAKNSQKTEVFCQCSLNHVTGSQFDALAIGKVGVKEVSVGKTRETREGVYLRLWGL